MLSRDTDTGFKMPASLDLLRAAERGDGIAMRTALAQKRFLPDQLAEALERAFEKKREDLAFFLLQAGAPRPMNGEYGFHEAVMNDMPWIYRPLLRAGINPNDSYPYGNGHTKPIQVAAARGDVLLTKELVQAGADLSVIRWNSEAEQRAMLQLFGRTMPKSAQKTTFAAVVQPVAVKNFQTLKPIFTKPADKANIDLKMPGSQPIPDSMERSL
jgi:ankyrin repeat protein